MKLLISDLDGTFYPRKETKNPNQLQDNYKAVKKWVDSGNKFAVATARGVHHYSDLTKALGFDINFIGTNGAAVLLENKEKIVKQLPCQVFIDVCRFVKENKLDASVTTGLNNQWIWSRNDGYPRGVKAYDTIWDSIFIANLDEINPEAGIERIQIFTPPENRNRLKELLISKNFPANVTTSDKDMIDMGPLHCSKGISILELCERFQLTPEDIIVVGDSENDIAMFDITKHSYCIDLAEEHVIKSASKTVTSVAEVIELELAIE